MVNTPHYFGGVWTELKLEAISAYSKFFTRALKAKDFDLWYIDPFAGTGSREEMHDRGWLLPDEEVKEELVSYPGSAAIALSVQPPFHHFVFGDERKDRRDALAELRDKHPGTDIRIVPGDANHALQKLFGEPPLAKGSMGRGSARAFVFLDPYGMSVKWATLQALARSERADVWFLVNLKAAVQQLCRDHNALDDHKRSALYECFGTHDWETEFYEFDNRQGQLFSNEAETRGFRNVDKPTVARYHRKRLESLFAYVSDPLPLSVGAHDDYFLLYCLSNNPYPRARALIAKGAGWVVTHYKEMASRHKSGR
jgi:three-Cys-motif partner protein